MTPLHRLPDILARQLALFQRKIFDRDGFLQLSSVIEKPDIGRRSPAARRDTFRLFITATVKVTHGSRMGQTEAT